MVYQNHSTPRIEIAERFYASEFIYGGIKYKGVFQNRINPMDMDIPDQEPFYWRQS